MITFLGTILGVSVLEAAEIAIAVGSVMIAAQPVVDTIASAIEEA